MLKSATCLGCKKSGTSSHCTLVTGSVHTKSLTLLQNEPCTVVNLLFWISMLCRLSSDNAGHD